jgi:hypothetical protein
MDNEQNAPGKLSDSPLTVKSLVCDGSFINVSDIAKRQGFEYPVMVSSSLANVLTPTEFLSGLGIKFGDRISNVVSVLQGNMYPVDAENETLPEGCGFDISITQGPVLQEKLVSIKAEQHTDTAKGTPYIILTLIPETDC